MTKIYEGNHTWTLIFSNGYKIQLSERQLKEIVEQANEILCKKDENERTILCEEGQR